MVSILGVNVAAVTTEELTETVRCAAQCGDKAVIANFNLRAIYLHHTDPKVREFFHVANLVHVDGMPMVKWAKALGLPLSEEHRTTYVDWIDPLMRMCAVHGLRVFYLGSKCDVVSRGAERLRQRHVSLCLEVRDGYFAADETSRVIGAINRMRPHVLLVGMGMPRQEKWILEHRNALNVNVILPSGAAMDYIAGAIPTPPRWTGRLGIEWLWRLIAEPRRLWRRYLVEPWYLVPYAVHDLRGAVRRGFRAS